eukprot:COSAG01_NODE_22997_length_832_cov_4.186903_1_plen_178_part_00
MAGMQRTSATSKASTHAQQSTSHHSGGVRPCCGGSRVAARKQPSMDTLSELRQRVVDVQRALGLPEPPPPAAPAAAAAPGGRTGVSGRPRYNRPGEVDSDWAALDARDGLLFAGLALVTTAAVTSGSKNEADARSALMVVEKAPLARRLAGAVLGTAGAGLFVFGAVGSRFDIGRPR